MDRYKIFFMFLFTILTSVYGRRVQNPCPKGEIPCDNGQCISRWNWCNDEFDCADQSDEKFCQRRSTFGGDVNNNCTDKHYVCRDGMCIPAATRCDGDWDCYGSDDEDNCDIPDLDESTSFSTREPVNYLPTTPSMTTTEAYTSSSTSYYHWRRREEENNLGREYGRRDPYTSTNPPVTHPYIYQPPTIDFDTFDNQRNNQGGYPSRGSDTFPGGNFPSNQQPTYPPRSVIDITPQGTPHRPTTTGTRQHPSRYPYDRPVIQPPRSILYPPRLTPLSSSSRSVRRPDYSQFYFTRNYTEDVAYRYKAHIQFAKEWIIAQRDKSYSWGKDTPRGLIALSLIHNSFKSDVEDNELMKKGLQTHLGIKLLRNDTGIEIMSTTRQAMYINALLASCQNPHDFLGVDLAEDLFYRQNRLEQNQQFVNPLIYLTLCLTDKYVHQNYLLPFLRNSFPSEISKDLHILATIAMACVAQRNPRDHSVTAKLNEAAQNLLSLMNRTDGSFGSKYSTALAAQALMSVNTSLHWDEKKTLDYLASQQQRDGSFGDMQSTYYTVLALSGRSLVHLRNTLCDPADVQTEKTPDDILNTPGPRKSILYTLRVGYPETFSAGMQLSVPNDTTFYDIMRVAAYQDPRFKFNYEISKGNLYNVHTIASIPNDPERGMFWTLYWMKQTDRFVDLKHRFLGNIVELVPGNGDELIYWYLSDFF